MAGRGWGKTRTGAQAVLHAIEHLGAKRIALVGRTAADVGDVMFHGESGIMACCPPWLGARAVQRHIRFANGALITGYTAETPDQLRGPQHDFAWADEIATWQYPETWDQLQFGLRLGAMPRVVATTTPRPIPLVKTLLREKTTHVTIGTTYENQGNLAEAAILKFKRKYEGTRLGRQELLAELLEDIPGALWTHEMLDRLRVPPPQDMSDYQRIVVAVDPSGGSNEKDKGDDERHDEQGIVVAGLHGWDREAHILADRSCSLSPDGWGKRACLAAQEYGADCIVVEVNFGGEMAEHVIKTAARDMGFHVRVKKITASRGKSQRAEPVAGLYEQGRVKHAGSFAQLEDQLCGFTTHGYEGEGSPDRGDSGVWAITELMLGPDAPRLSEKVVAVRTSPRGARY